MAQAEVLGTEEHILMIQRVCWMLLAGAALGASVVETPGRGQITWENRQVDVRPGMLDTNVAVIFKFSNIGNQPLTLGNVKADCSCTVASVQKKVYAAGESGEIEAKYSIGNRMGLQQAQIYVESDDPAQPISQLTMRVFISELVKVSPSFIYWLKGEEKAPKTIKLKVVHDSPIRIIGVSSTNDRLFPQLKTIKAGEEYEITVTPFDTIEPAKATLRIESDFPKEKPRLFYAYAAIKEAEKEPAVSPLAVMPPATGAAK